MMGLFWQKSQAIKKIFPESAWFIGGDRFDSGLDEFDSQLQPI